MRRSLTFKLILCYIIIVFCAITISNTIGNYMFQEQLKEETLNDLSTTANNILDSKILKNYFSDNKFTNNKTNKDNITPHESKNETTHEANIKAHDELRDDSTNKSTEDSSNSIDSSVDLTEYLHLISKTSHINIWLLDSDNKFIYTSINNNKFKGKNINKYYPRFLYLSNYDDIYIKNLTPSKSLCKVVKIKPFSDKETYGYLVFSTEINNISRKNASFMAILNTLVIGLCLLLAIIFILIYFVTIHPIHQLTNYAIAATQGNVNSPLKIKTNDEYKDLGNALIYLSSELNNLDEYQRKFISNISHDFRSPLTSIKGYLEAMLDGTIPPESNEKFIRIILFEAERLTDLTTNLLTLNNLDGHKQLLDKTTFDINYIISKTIEVYEGRCQKQKITLSTNFENQQQYVYADQSKIQQVINNLLDNAIKFSPANSSIVLSTYIKSEKVFVSIKDHGAGIAKENISHIWERFYKIDASRGKDKRGTGLGLSITKEIINAHHENINVTSTQGVGTEFTFSLPKKNN